VKLRQTIDNDNDITSHFHHHHVFTYLTRFQALTDRSTAHRIMDVQQLQEILRVDQQIAADARTTEERGGKDDTFRL